MDPPAQQASPVAPKSRVQRIREMEANPYVKSCMEIFAGEIIRIDEPPRQTVYHGATTTAAQDDQSP